MKKSFFTFLIVIFFLSNTALSANNDSVLLTRKRDLGAIGRELKEAILKQDAAVILKYVSRDGILCIDRVVQYGKVLKDLKDKSSWLYSYLFAPKEFGEKYKNPLRPMALKQYFNNTSDIQIEVSFIEHKGKPNPDWGCIRYKSGSAQTNFVPELCFNFMNGKWFFSNSPYICGG